MSLNYKKQFLDFLVASSAVKFGEFTLKSGRISPYFVNFGSFDSSAKLARLGEFYAEHYIRENFPLDAVLFGPAYKGITLAVSTALELGKKKDIDVRFGFDRKERKTHGDVGNYVGSVPYEGDKVVVIEDVISAGTTLREFIPRLREDTGVEVAAIIVAVDRCERGESAQRASLELEDSLGLKVSPIIDMHGIREALAEDQDQDPKLIEGIDRYIEQYGA